MLLGGFKFLKNVTFLFFPLKPITWIPEQFRYLTASDVISIVWDSDRHQGSFWFISTVSFQILSIPTIRFFSLHGSMS